MPITVIATEGVIPAAAEAEAFAALSELFLQQHQLGGNAFMTPNVIGELNVVPKGRTFAGGRPNDIVIVELKVPSFALGSADQKKAFVDKATDIVHRAAGGRLARERIFVNMTHAVDGLWGIGGKAYTNQDLLDAVAGA